MSGHSKWATIKRQKGAADQKRGNLFTKLGHAITIATREGGGDPETNFKLRLAMDRAKSFNMPKENMERAIKRGTGEVEGAEISEITYEVFGPGGVGLIIEVVTDNKNRSLSDVKNILSKNGGRLGTEGSVNWMFKRKGMVIIPINKMINKDELELTLIDAGAEDIQENEGALTITTAPENVENLKTATEKTKAQVEYAGVDLVPKNKQMADQNISEKIKKLVTELEDSDDVNNVYTTHEITFDY